MTPYTKFMQFIAEEISFWRSKPLAEKEYKAFAHSLLQTESELVLFELKNWSVRCFPDVKLSKRAWLYKSLFERVSRYFLSPKTEIFIPCLLGDLARGRDEAPLLSFQKEKQDKMILLPDFDCLHNFYESRKHRDPYVFSKKEPKAIFVGATTGTINSIATIDKNERIRLAKYFEGNPEVIFKLPSICQCDGEETEKFLRSYSFCQGDKIQLQEQFKHKYLISVDGNGATCSRVSLALKSNSVLFKYKSDYIVWFHKQLVPWVHYVPVNCETDIEKYMEFAKTDASKFAEIASKSREFYDTYLGRFCIYQYTATLLNELYGIFRADEIYLHNKARIDASNGMAARIGIEVLDLGRHFEKWFR